MVTPNPVPIFRMTHIDNLSVYLQRGGIHAPLCVPDDGLTYKTIHDVEIQNVRRIQTVPCGNRGQIHNYVPFYFGYRSPMLLRLSSGSVTGYNEGQTPIIYLVTTVENVIAAQLPFVFSDGHGIAKFTMWFDRYEDLENIDWNTVYARYWHDSLDDNDRQRRKQAEFLIYHFCPLHLISCIGVYDMQIQDQVIATLNRYSVNTPVYVRKQWYY